MQHKYSTNDFLHYSYLQALESLCLCLGQEPEVFVPSGADEIATNSFALFLDSYCQAL